MDCYRIVFIRILKVFLVSFFGSTGFMIDKNSPLGLHHDHVLPIYDLKWFSLVLAVVDDYGSSEKH